MSPKYAKDQPAGFVNRIEKVAIVGAGGTIGSYFTKWLLKSGKHTITALTRHDSSNNNNNKFPDGVRAVPIDYNNPSTIVDALRGQHFLVITLPARGAAADAEAQLIRAAAAAGVPYVMPNAYGPDPLNAPLTADDMLIGAPFAAARALVEQLGVSSWVALACGFWFEWSLLGGDGGDRFGADVRARKMTFFDDGAEPITTTTWDQCGRALAGLLRLPRLRPHPDAAADAGKTPVLDDWANRAVYVSSFRVSQRDMFAGLQRATGTRDADWTVEHVRSDVRFRESRAAFVAGAGADHRALSRTMYTRIFFPTGEGDHARHGLANEALGLPHEDLDQAIRDGFPLLEQGKLSYY